MKKITLIFLMIAFTTFAQNKDVVDYDGLNSRKSKDFIEFEDDLKAYSAEVKVITTCSTNPNLCGNLAFGSASLVEILDGKHRGEKIYVLALCKETNYQLGKIYKLTISNSPNFGVGLCDNIIYDRNWKKSNLEKSLTIFGNLN